MNANKVTLDGTVLIDLTQDTVTERDVAYGKTFHKADGSKSVGSAKDGLNINGLIKQYKVNAGANVSAGDFVEFVKKWNAGEFTNTTVLNIEAVKLDETRVLVVYIDAGDKYRVKAQILAIENGNVHAYTSCYLYWGSPGDDTRLSVAVLSKSRAVILMDDEDNRPYVALLAIDVETNTVEELDGRCSLDDESTVSSTEVTLIVITETTLLAAYASGGSGAYCRVKVITVVDDVLQIGVALVFSGSKAPEPKKINLVRLSNEQAFIFMTSYLMVPGTSSMYALASWVLTIRGSVATVGGATVHYYSVKNTGLALTNHTGRSACGLDGDRVLVMYAGIVQACQIDGSTVNPGAEVEIASANASQVDIVALSDTRALVTYQDTDDNGASIGYLKTLNIDGTTVEVIDTAVLEDAGAPTYTNLVHLTGSTCMALYTCNGVSKYKNVTVDEYGIITVTEKMDTDGTFVQRATSNLGSIGVAKTGGSSGSTIDVYTVQ